MNEHEPVINLFLLNLHTVSTLDEWMMDDGIKRTVEVTHLDVWTRGYILLVNVSKGKSIPRYQYQAVVETFRANNSCSMKLAMNTYLSR